jgi:lysophospholipase L1-like esterase
MIDLKKYLILGLLCYAAKLFGQPVIPPVTIPQALKVDSTYMQINYYSKKQAQALERLFKNADKEKVVFFHFGGSHVQGDILTSMARNNFVKTYGNGGRGMIFSYSAASTYSSLYYNAKHKGNWQYGKSFMSGVKVPLGICGMGVETNDHDAQLEWVFKQSLKKNKYKITVFTEIDSLTPSFKLQVDSLHNFEFDYTKRENQPPFISFNYEGEINQLQLKLTDSASGIRFRFYGINIETDQPGGVVYHALGVGAAAMRSVLGINRLKEQAAFLKPDIVILDFGTNDILYTNAIDPKVSEQVEEAIKLFRSVNPSVQILLTTTQDLFYKKKKLITAGVDFRNLMDSLARKNDCLFWNWFDLSGGLRSIKVWRDEGYAQPDLVHLTVKGYHVKGQLLYDSFIRTLNYIEANPDAETYTTAMKNYDEPEATATDVVDEEVKEKPKERVKTEKNNKTYKVKKGDSLGRIAEKHHTTVEKLKKLNKISSDKIKAGQVIKVK